MTDLYIDADSLLHQCASPQDTRYWACTHTPSKRVKHFGKKADGVTWVNDWVAESPHKRSVDDFAWEQKVSFTGSLLAAQLAFVGKVEAIKEAVAKHTHYDKTYVCIGGPLNFRKSVEAKFVEYKAQRTSIKPTVFDDLVKFVKQQYGESCIVSDNEETDDVVIRAVFSGNVVACMDKDIVANCVGWLYNFSTEEWKFNSDEDRWKKFCQQMLEGDKADNIPGVKKLSKEVQEKYGIGTSGVGPVAAEKLLDGCKTEKEAWERVIEAYSSSPVSSDMWQERMQENAFFLWMCREKEQIFNLKDYLKGLGIVY